MLKKTEKVSKNINLIAWFNFLLDLRLYAPIAILYFTKVSGSFALGMSIFSLAMLSSAFFEIPTGIYSDKIGRRKIIILGASVTVISVVFYAIGINYWFLVIGAILEGVARSFYSGNNDSLLFDSLLESGLEKDFAEHKGKTDSTAQMAIAIVSIIGSVIAYWSFSYVMWLSVIPAIIGLIVSIKIIEPKIQKIQSGNIYSHLTKAIINFIFNKKLRLLSLSSMIGYAQGEAGYQFRAAFFQTLWPIWAIGIAKAVGSIGATISFYWSGKIIKKYGALKTILIGKGYSLITNIISTLFPNFYSPIIMSSNSLFFGSGSTASESLKHKEYTNEERATMSSLDSLLGSIMFAIVSFLLGVVADYLNPAKGILLLQILAFFSILITWKLYKNEKNEI